MCVRPSLLFAGDMICKEKQIVLDEGAGNKDLRATSRDGCIKACMDVSTCNAFAHGNGDKCHLKTKFSIATAQWKPSGYSFCYKRMCDPTLYRRSQRRCVLCCA